jgi:hypothetical protein
MAVPPLKLPTLPSGQPIVDPKTGAPTNTFQIWIQQFANSIEYSINGIAAALEAAGIALDAAEVALDAADEAQTAADNAQDATDGISASQSLVQSGIPPESIATPPLIQAADTGDITISDHDRLYGNGTSVAVDGDTFASGFTSGDIVYVYYFDPARAGGAVSYQASLNSNDAVQTGDTHSIGSVEVPAAGTQDGNYVLPPGVVQP